MLNIALVTQDDPFYLPVFFKAFKEEIKKQQLEDVFRIHGIAIQAPLGDKKLSDLVSRMYHFYGPANFLQVGTKYVTWKILNAIAVKVFKGQFPNLFSVEHFAEKNNWPVLKNVDVNSNDFFEFVRSKDLDLLVSVGGSQKFKKRILETPKYGCINIHNSKLPKFRGMLPTFWALLNIENDPVSATTIFKMDEELDSGPIILQDEFLLQKEESLDYLIKRTKRKGAKLMIEAIKKYQVA